MKCVNSGKRAVKYFAARQDISALPRYFRARPRRTVAASSEVCPAKNGNRQGVAADRHFFA